MNNRGLVPHLLLANAVVGGLLMFAGVLAEARPHILLDVVLTSDEIRDETLANKTLNLMKRGAGWDAGFMVLGGAIVCATALAARWWQAK